MESDFRPLSSMNVIFKYADDTNLLVPETADISLSDEFKAIQDWATVNALIINMNKTKELLFHRPHPRKFDLAPVSIHRRY